MMPFLQAMEATTERYFRPFGLLILDDSDHIIHRPGTESMSLLTDKNYLHICRSFQPGSRKIGNSANENRWTINH